MYDISMKDWTVLFQLNFVCMMKNYFSRFKLNFCSFVIKYVCSPLPRALKFPIILINLIVRIRKHANSFYIFTLTNKCINMNNWRYIIIDHDCVTIALRFKIFAIAKQIVEAYHVYEQTRSLVDRSAILRVESYRFIRKSYHPLPAKVSYFAITILIINRMLIP